MDDRQKATINKQICVNDPNMCNNDFDKLKNERLSALIAHHMAQALPNSSVCSPDRLAPNGCRAAACRMTYANRGCPAGHGLNEFLFDTNG